MSGIIHRHPNRHSQQGDTTYGYRIVIAKPAVTHAAVSSGRLVLSGHNEAAAVASTAELQRLVNERALPGDSGRRETTIAAGASGDDAMVLGGDLTIYGDALSAGGIRQEGDVKFLASGLAKTERKDIDVLQLDVLKYDPISRENVVELESDYSGANSFQANYRRTGDLRMSGDVRLDGALLFVDGDITIDGSVTGEGAIVASGSVTIAGHAELAADSQVAVLAGKDLTLKGTSKDRSLFSGLLYAEREVSVSNVTTVGGLIASNSDDPSSAGMQVEDARLLNLPEKTQFNLSAVVTPPDVPRPGGQFQREMSDLDLELVDPDFGSLVNQDGTWNGNSPSFSYSKGGQVYSRLSDIPGLDSGSLAKLQEAEAGLLIAWEQYLTAMEPLPQTVVPIFHLAPNELLSIAGGEPRIILKLPL